MAIPKAYVPRSKPKRVPKQGAAAAAYRAAREKGLSPESAFYKATKLPAADAFTYGGKRNRAQIKRTQAVVKTPRRTRPTKGAWV